jgi:hypothetical protein
VLTDDLEVYERIQRGSRPGAADWAYVGRGFGRDVGEPGGSAARPARARSSSARRCAPGCDYMIASMNVEQFLYHEARLLDTQQLEEWLELFTDDATYWVPLEAEQKDPSRPARSSTTTAPARAAGEAGAPPARARRSRLPAPCTRSAT